MKESIEAAPGPRDGIEGTVGRCDSQYLSLSLSLGSTVLYCKHRHRYLLFTITARSLLCLSFSPSLSPAPSDGFTNTDRELLRTIGPMFQFSLAAGPRWV